MKIYLFGGAERDLGQSEPLYSMIGNIINKINPKQVLHIPHAYTRYSLRKRHEKIKSRINLKENIELLTATKQPDIKKAKNPLILITGGGNQEKLVDKIRSNKKLFELIINASWIIGESAGAMVLCKYMRNRADNPDKIIKGLNLVKNSLLEPHYTERGRHQLLREEMKQAGVQYGIGIDCVTGISFERGEFPEKYEKIGDGLVEIVTL